jgi:hypothetical protein
VRCGFEKAEMIALAHRAVELDKDDAIVLTYSAYALALIAHDLDAGAALTERATDVNPNLAVNRHWNGTPDRHPKGKLEADEGSNLGAD